MIKSIPKLRTLQGQPNSFNRDITYYFKCVANAIHNDNLMFHVEPDPSWLKRFSLSHCRYCRNYYRTWFKTVHTL
jgi:hypothetical protein